MNVHHFDGKAEIERYIRGSGVPATFFLAGVFMTEVVDMLRRHEDKYVIALPLEDDAKVPFIDIVADTGGYKKISIQRQTLISTGLFIKGAIKNRDAVLGKRIYASAAYYTFGQIVREFTSVTGLPAAYMKISEEQFKSFLPEHKAADIYEMLMMIQEFGYYAGAELDESLGLVERKPTNWKQFVEKNRETWV